MLENKLKGSKFSDPEIIKSMTGAFEREVRFNSQTIRFCVQL
jgi:hypothetical protein